MSSTLPRDRRSAAVRAILNFDAPPIVTYRRDAERIVISVGTAAVVLSPGVARELAHSLAGAVDAAEGHGDPGEPAAAPSSAGEDPADG